MKIPLVDLKSQQLEVADEVRSGLDRIFATSEFIGGHQVAAFEMEYAEFINTRYCIGVANGTDALELALRAVGVSADGEVILPANTFIATAEAVSRIGAKPVPVDVDATHLLIDPKQVEPAITPRTQAIVPVHLFGKVAPIERIKDVAGGLPIIEDAAQAQGARRLGALAGGLGAAGATSFYPGKNLGAAGDAGAVTTNDRGIADTVRLLRSHGSRIRYLHEVVGLNSRLDSIQAVVLRAKLSRLQKWNDLRRAAARRYTELLGHVAGIVTPCSPAENEDVWHLYVVRVDNRDRVLADLHNAGIAAAIHYPTPVHLTGAYQFLKLDEGSLPVAETAAKRILSLPIYPHITEAAQDYVVHHLVRAVSRWS